MKRILFLILGLAVTYNCFSQSGSNDPTFNPDDLGFGYGDGFNNIVRTTLIQPDEKILVGGSFTSYNGTVRNRIVRLNSDGTIDASFNIGTGFNNLVYSIELQSDGKIIVGGNFTSFNGTSRARIARLNPDGSLDASFNPGTGFNGYVYTTVIQDDGKIIAGGSFTSFNGTTANHIARLNDDGTPDIDFDPGTGFNNIVFSLSILNDTTILAGGSFTTYNDTVVNRLVKLYFNATIDDSFVTGTGFNNIVYSVAVQSDGNVLVGGSFTSFNGTTRNRIVRLDPNGSLDLTFTYGTGFNNIVYSISIQSDEKLIVGGNFTTYSGTSRARIARINSDGTLDVSLNPGTGFSAIVYSTSIKSDNQVIVGGSFTSYDGIAINRIARIDSLGVLDESFILGTGLNNIVYSVVVQNDGKILLGGSFTSYNGNSLNRIARLNSDGTLDTTFNIGSGFSNIVRSIAVQDDGKILVGGSFTSFNGTGRNRIARLNPNGSLDATFVPGTGFNNIVYSIIVQADDKILVGGNFTTYKGTLFNRIARIEPDGNIDGTFNPGTGFDNAVYSIGVQDDNKIIVGGNFTIYNGILRNRIVRMDPTGDIDISFDPGTGFVNIIYSLAIQNNGKILAGGNYTSYNGISRNRIARINSDGSIDLSFNPGSGFNNAVNTIVVQSDSKILVGGSFTSFSGTGRNRIARIDSTGSLDLIFNPGTGFNNIVNAVCLQSDEKVLAGGNFTAFNGIGRNRITRLLNCQSQSSITQTACESFTLNVQTYSSSGFYTQVLTGASGCDSIIVLDLTIDTADASVTENGNILTANAVGAIYQWVDCDNNNLPIQGEESQIFTATVAGNYAVVVTENGCTNTSDCFEILTVGNVNITKATKWLIYPNPAQSDFNLEMNSFNTEETEILFVNSLGKTVYQEKIVFSAGKSIRKYDLSNYSKGVYTIKIITGDNQVVKKLVLN
jgi:uncharacterized delta-60 repeat protein